MNRRFFAAMNRSLLLVLTFSLWSCIAYSQEKTRLHGLLLHGWGDEPVAAAHIINFSDSLAVISSTEGLFRLPADAGDSVLITSIGYMDKALVVTEEMLAEEVTIIHISPRNYELAEVEVNPFGTKEQFRERFMELQVDDGVVDVVGIQKPSKEPRDIPLTEDADEIKKAKYLANPASFLYGNLSKDAKMRQELHRLREQDRKYSANDRKYNEEVVARITGYEGKTIRAFMDFCNFSESDIYQYNDYQLTIAILSRQREFEQRGSRSDR